jgi:hypothetical protein
MLTAQECITLTHITCLSNISVLGNGNLGGLKLNGNDNLRTI